MRRAITKGAIATFFLLGLGLAASPVWAADQAREAVGLFVQSCLKYVATPTGLREWIAKTPELRQLPPKKAQQFLSGKLGDVWSASNKAGEFALVLFSDDTCTVMAQQAGADEVSKVFSDYVRRKKLPLDKVGDRKQYVGGIDEREEVYRSNAGRILYEVVLLTSKSMRADVQAALTTRPNR